MNRYTPSYALWCVFVTVIVAAVVKLIEFFNP